MPGRLYCIVASRAEAAAAKPDMGKYSPKQLADKEHVTVTTVYRWVKLGLPSLRHGDNGDIQIYYQDYIAWMIECARDPDSKVKDIPLWAHWFVRAEGWKSPINR